MAAERKHKLEEMDKNRIMKEALEDLDRTLDVSGVSKGLKGSYVKILKEVASRTRGTILFMADEINRMGRRSTKGINSELVAEVNTLKDELAEARNTIGFMRVELDTFKEELQKMEANKRKKEKERKEVATSPIPATKDVAEHTKNEEKCSKLWTGCLAGGLRSEV